MKREELIAYDKWLTENKWGSCEIVTPEQAADLYLVEHPLPPAEGAEKVQRCPVCMGRGLVPNSFYATTSGIGSTTQTYLPEKCRTCNGAGVIILPYPKLQPTAEGAEEILKRHCKENKIILTSNDFHTWLNAINEFATLHTRKMVEENLREELIAYDKYASRWIDNYRAETAEDCVDEYLKSKEQ